MTQLKYSVVIPIDHLRENLKSVESLLRLPKKEKPETIYICVGKNPSLQRNMGVARCKTPVIYFLDDDSMVSQGNIKSLLSHFQNDRVAVVGGPNLAPPNATSFERTASAVLASWLGSFKVRTRYAAIGSVKEATEKDLILCNMMVQRGIFEKMGGFRTDLYPNEENEFLNRLLHQEYQLIYDPSAVVYRHRRKDPWAFCWQAFRYGRGRARQIKVYPCLSDLVHLAPLFFLFYIIALGLPWALDLSSIPGAAYLKTWIGWGPFLLFTLAAVGTGLSAASWHRRALDSIKVPVLILLRHVFYGAGLWAGFFSSIPKPPMGVKVYKVQWAKKGPKFIPLQKATR